VAGGKVPGQGGADNEMTAISEINVTPFVDVVLVLLVIFMVTAPMLVREQMNVNLPKAATGEKSAAQSLTIVISKEGMVSIGDKPATMQQVEEDVKAAVAKDPNAQAVISADQDSRHGDVVKVMDLIKKAGLTKFAIQIEQK
jgi:biopolymer transport protein ExbD